MDAMFNKLGQNTDRMRLQICCSEPEGGLLFTACNLFLML